MHKKRKSLLIPLIFIVVTVATLLKLGWWQLEQKQRKEALIARIEQRAGAPARFTSVAELVSQNTSVDDLDYTPISLNGHFIHESEVAVFTNREMGSAQFAGPGYDILTAFQDTSGGIILVNRGFVPQDFRAIKSRALGQTIGEVKITGLIRKPERHSYVDVPDRPERNEFAVRDPKTIIAFKLSDAQKNDAQKNNGSLIDSFYIDLRTPVPDGLLPSPNKTSVSIPNRHLEYVITWWGLALVFIGMFGVFVRQHRLAV